MSSEAEIRFIDKDGRYQRYTFIDDYVLIEVDGEPRRVCSNLDLQRVLEQFTETGEYIEKAT